MKNKVLENIKQGKSFPDHYLDAAYYNYYQAFKNKTNKVK